MELILPICGVCGINFMRGACPFQVGKTTLAHAQGGLINASALGASLGVSHHTIGRHLDILEQTFLIRRLSLISGMSASAL